MRRALVFPLLLLAAAPLRASLFSVGLDTNAFTSDYMIGNVVVAIVFPESDGSLDQKSETWSEERKSKAIGEIMAGHDWTKQNKKSALSFTYVTETVSTKYEPITRPYYQETLWIPDVMGKLGYSGSRFTSTKNYINHLRQQYNADWGFVIFVIDSQNDPNGKFSDGYFAYSYLGGPFMVMTYTNGGYGISNMDVVAAHEMGHIFNALDEYAGASSPYDYSAGYFSVINGNHAWSSIANDPNSVMRGGIRWGLDKWAREMIGWRDSDGNGLDDILDTTPIVQVNQQIVSLAQGRSRLSGIARVSVLPRQNNADGNGITLNTIAKVQFRIANGEWAEATPSDGKFDSPEENFMIEVASNVMSAQSFSAASVEVRAITDYTLASGANSGGTRPTAVTISTLENAHAFPNPFKPNSGVGHSNITFTNLTSGAKVQIFSPDGTGLFESEPTSSSSSLTWDGLDKDGSTVASGVYYYLITDPSGQKKKGKIAIIR
jgi:hypothetical protein